MHATCPKNVFANDWMKDKGPCAYHAQPGKKEIDPINLTK